MLLLCCSLAARLLLAARCLLVRPGHSINYDSFNGFCYFRVSVAVNPATGVSLTLQDTVATGTARWCHYDREGGEFVDPGGVDCAGEWSGCTADCARTWTTTVAQSGAGAACPQSSPPCAAGQDACPVDTDCAGEWSACTADCTRSWQETTAQSGQGAVCDQNLPVCVPGEEACPTDACPPPTEQCRAAGTRQADGTCTSDTVIADGQTPCDDSDPSTAVSVCTQNGCEAESSSEETPPVVATTPSNPAPAPPPSSDTEAAESEATAAEQVAGLVTGMQNGQWTGLLVSSKLFLVEQLPASF